MATPHSAPVHTLVVGVFESAARARAAVDELRVAGFMNDQIECTCDGPEHRAHATNQMSPDGDGEWVDDEISAGHTVVTVNDADERAEDVRDLLRKHGGTIREPSPIGSYGTGLPATPF
jgi:hypothetical protein